MAVIATPGAVGFDDGEYNADQRGWWTCCPDCLKPGMLAGHTLQFTVGLGSAVTITPSCICNCGAHWFVVEGQITRADNERCESTWDHDGRRCFLLAHHDGTHRNETVEWGTY